MLLVKTKTPIYDLERNFGLRNYSEPTNYEITKLNEELISTKSVAQGRIKSKSRKTEEDHELIVAFWHRLIGFVAARTAKTLHKPSFLH